MKRAKAIAMTHPFPYGASELKMWSEKMTFKGFIFSILLLTIISFLIAGSIYLFNDNTVLIPSLIPGTTIDLVNTRVQRTFEYHGTYRVPTTFGFKQVAGNPIPTPISDFKGKTNEFADLGNLGKVLSTEGNREIPKDNEPLFSANKNTENETELSPEDFVAVEVEPYIDIAELQRKVVYPEMARRANIEGKVIVRVLVGKDGKPLKSIIEDTDNELLNEAAVKAIMSSVFTPARQNGISVALWISIPINFRLR